MTADEREQVVATRGRRTKVVDVPELESIELHGAGSTVRIDGTVRLITPSARAMLTFREIQGEKGSINPQAVSTLLASAVVDGKDKPKLTEAMAANLLDLISTETAMFLLQEIMALTPARRKDDAEGKAPASPSATSGTSPTDSASP